VGNCLKPKMTMGHGRIMEGYWDSLIGKWIHLFPINKWTWYHEIKDYLKKHFIVLALSKIVGLLLIIGTFNLNYTTFVDCRYLVTLPQMIILQSPHWLDGFRQDKPLTNWLSYALGKPENLTQYIPSQPS
jgi:hypothetical protein